MDLKAFVAEALSEIIEGVREAQERVKGTGGVVNPIPAGPVAKDLMSQGYFWVSGGIAQMVAFDVAVTATETAGGKGGIGVVVAAMTLGASGQRDSERSATSHIKFVVPVT